MADSDRISAIEPNSLGLALSKMLRKGRDIANSPGTLPESVPLLGGMGAGDLLMGKAPEAIEDYSYGFGPLGHGKGMTTKVDPRVLDIAGLPGIGVGGAMKGGKLAKEAIMSNLLREGTDVSRREFLKGAGALAGGAAGAMAMPDMVKLVAKGLGKESAAAASSQAAKAGTAGLVKEALAGLKGWVASHADDLSNNWNYGSGGAPNSENIAKAATHFGENLPVAELEEMAKHGPLHKDLLGDIIANETPHARISRQNEDKWADYLRKIPNGEIPTKGNFSDPKMVKLYDQYMATGELPKGAPEWMRYVDPSAAPAHSATGKLWEKALGSWAEDISGYGG